MDIESVFPEKRVFVDVPFKWAKDSPVTNKDIREFATNIRDFNPLHHDDVAAKKAGLKGIIAPGVMIMGFVSEAIANEIPGVIVRHIEIDFVQPLYESREVGVHCELLKKKGPIATVAVTVTEWLNPVAKGSCVLILPQKAA